MSQGENLGELFQRARLERGWSVATAAALYGFYGRGRPVSEGAIYKLEEGRIPKDLKRRWVLARMYNITPAVLGLSLVPQANKMPVSRKTRAVDVKEFERTFISYWKNGYRESAEEALIDIGIRINALHDAAYYSLEEEKMKRLLCSYHMLRAEVGREVGYDSGALWHLNQVVILAEKNHYADLMAAALYRRGEIYFDAWEHQKALDEFNAAAAVQKTLPSTYPTPPDVVGRITIVKGLTLARLAQSQREMSVAMQEICKSEKFIRSAVQEPVCMLNFSKNSYAMYYAKGLVGPAVGKLHRPDEATDILVENKAGGPLSKRFAKYKQLEENLIYALAYMDKGYYPAAATLFQDSLEFIGEGCRMHLPVVQRGYERLLESSYGRSEEVAELGLRLLVVQAPQLFR